MSEQETVKVYELAKELGIDSISLLDKLKGLNIQVKNHMSDLRNEEVELARTSLRKPDDSKTAKKAAAPRTKKKAAPASADAPAGASLAGTATPAAVKKTTVKRKAAEPEATPEAAKAASAPIIRRRVKADGATETVTHAVGSTAPIQPFNQVPPAAAAGADAQAFEQETVEFEETAVEADFEAAPETVETAPQSPGASGATSAGAVAATPSAPQTPASGVTAGPSAGATSAGLQRPVAPRRSILKIVEPSAPPPRPVIKPAPTVTPKQVIRPGAGGPAGDKEGFRIVKMTKENLDQMAEEEAAKKRGGGREAEIRPEDVRFADYRKKEMVFLPKRKKLPVGKELKHTQKTTPKAEKRVVQMQETITVTELANQLSVKATDVVRKLMQMGTMATINQSIDFDTATLVANEYKYEVRNVAFDETTLFAPVEDKVEDLVARPPVVTIMGHVDHGKTTLLDSIREANVAAGEAGGITQHIGAYTIEKNGKLITFIDTPGHEAFSVMRARGANVTDIVILVVSADDGVMPQTREALSHAQAAQVPIIVAVNKIDKPGANPEKIKQGLSELNLLAEEWGGDTMFVPVSALKKTNIDKLLDSILLQAEVLDLKANPSGLATGTVLEARLERGRGPVMSVLINRGTLKVGAPIVSGGLQGKVKAMMDDKGRTVKEAGPGVAVEVLGLEGVPNAGEEFNSTATESDAKNIAEHRTNVAKQKAQATSSKMSLEDLFSKIKTGNVKELNVIVKADVYGSVEAVKDSLIKLSTDKVQVKVIHAATGGITESDILLASASNAVIIGFNVRPETKARQLAESEHVEVKSYSIIYELLDDVKKSMTGLLDKKKVERFLGRAEVRQIFSVPKIGVIAGTSVVDGKILRGANVRLLRDSRIIYEGKLSSLKRFKDDAKEVAQGFECGIGIENYNDLKPGDIIEAYQIDMVAPTLEEASAQA
jgi:translation initiation factor IF-2